MTLTELPQTTPTRSGREAQRTMTTTAEQQGYHAEEHLSRAELEALQLERLQWTVRHAYENVPFYRQRFEVERRVLLRIERRSASGGADAARHCRLRP